MKQITLAYLYVFAFGSTGIGCMFHFLGMDMYLSIATSVCLLFALCNVLYILTHPGA